MPLKSYLSTKKTTTTAFAPKKAPAPSKALAVSSLVDTTWDQEILKIGWLNRGSTTASTSEDHLRFCRVELKGCNLNVFKPSGDITDVKFFRPTVSNISSPTNNNSNGNNGHNSRTNNSAISLNSSAASINNISSLSSASSSASIIDNDGTASTLVNDNSSVANMSIQGSQLNSSAASLIEPKSQNVDVSDTISINSFATVGAKSTMTSMTNGLNLRSNDHNENVGNDENDNNNHDNERDDATTNSVRGHDNKDLSTDHTNDDLQSIETSKFGNLQTESTDSLDMTSSSQKAILSGHNSTEELSNENNIANSTDPQDLTSEAAKAEHTDGDDTESQADDVDERQTFMSASHVTTATDSIIEEEDNDDEITANSVNEEQEMMVKLQLNKAQVTLNQMICY
ncbi:unnamed protein product [[Candida] boidinii]|uniref:Unnamed protein product n=1 Tax=Candida boidinii TaxID=5477 RepID=A0ACB5U3R7_CANBO|nr:unnamed protein product [[Candida] boidinii]